MIGIVAPTAGGVIGAFIYKVFIIFLQDIKKEERCDCGKSDKTDASKNKNL